MILRSHHLPRIARYTAALVALVCVATIAVQDEESAQRGGVASLRMSEPMMYAEEAMDAARTAKLAAKAAEAARHAKIAAQMAEKSAAAAKMAQRVEASERFIRSGVGGGGGEREAGEFDTLIDDAIEKAKKSSSPMKKKPVGPDAVGVGEAWGGAAAGGGGGGGVGNGAIDIIELPPPAKSPERLPARPKSAKSPGGGQRRKGVGGGKKPTPAWALAPEQAKVLEEEEEEDLLSFAEVGWCES